MDVPMIRIRQQREFAGAVYPILTPMAMDIWTVSICALGTPTAGTHTTDARLARIPATGITSNAPEMLILHATTTAITIRSPIRTPALDALLPDP